MTSGTRLSLINHCKIGSLISISITEQNYITPHTGWKDSISILYFAIVHKSTPAKTQNRNTVFQTVHFGNITMFLRN